MLSFFFGKILLFRFLLSKTDHWFSMHTKVSEKLTFFTPWYAHVSGKKQFFRRFMCVLHGWFQTTDREDANIYLQQFHYSLFTCFILLGNRGEDSCRIFFEKSNTWNIILNTAASNQKVQSLLIWIHVHLGDMRYEKVAWWRPHDVTFAQLSAALSNDQDLSC